MATIVGAFLGAPDASIAAGFAGISLCINTTDRLNLDTASFSVVAEGFSQTVSADTSGRAYIEVPSGKTYTVTLDHQGTYQNDGPQKVIAESKMVYGVYFDLFSYSEMATIVRVYTGAGTTITGTSENNSIEVVADYAGVAEFRGLPAGSTWTFSDGYMDVTVEIDRIVVNISMITQPVVNEVSFGMSFNSSTFTSDPAGCLVYTGECAGFTPVSSPPSALGACSVLGSWDMNADGSSSNPFLDSCFYATFDEDVNIHERLNPKNLAEVIGLWNADKKGWGTASGISSIESENTMFCFPALYRKGDASSVTIGTKSSSGTAYGATIDGHTYQYEAIGVYEGYVQGSKLMSLSGKASSASITRPNFRTYAAANKVKNGLAMLRNFHQWRDWWHLYLFGAKSFNGQVSVGQGGFTYNGGVGQGLCNAMGLWAGSSAASASTATSVKALIENPWGYKYEFIDDFVNSSGTIYVGQNSTPDDTTSNKISTSFGTGSGWQSGLNSTGAFWGLSTGTSGSSTTYQCDYRYSNSPGTYLGGVGASSGTVSDGHVGPSCLGANGSLSASGSSLGARLAFVFDLDV